MSPSVCCSIHSCPAQQKRQCWQAWPCGKAARTARMLDTRHEFLEWPAGFSSSIQRPAGRCRRPEGRKKSLICSSFFRSHEVASKTWRCVGSMPAPDSGLPRLSSRPRPSRPSLAALDPPLASAGEISKKRQSKSSIPQGQRLEQRHVT